MINYVTDERGLNYKMLPSKTLSCSHEKSAPSLKKKEKVNMFAAMHLDSINYPKSATPWAQRRSEFQQQTSLEDLLYRK